MFYKTNEELGFDDVSIATEISEIESRKDINLLRKIGPIEAIPLIVSNTFTTGTIKAAKALHEYKIPVCLHKGYFSEELVSFLETPESQYTFLSLGLDSGSKEKEWMLKFHKLAILDVAHGGMTRFIDYVKYIKDTYPNCFIVAGNVITPETTAALCIAGADSIKLNIGVSKVCSTKNKTGVYRKPLSTLLDCEPVARSFGKTVCSDGGFLEPGHLGIAYRAGAHLCMSGTLFAGIKEISDGAVTDTIMGERIEYFGSSSKKANNKYFNGLSDYKASEGNELIVPTKNLVEQIQDILGGLRSYCSYIGRKNI